MITFDSLAAMRAFRKSRPRLSGDAADRAALVGWLEGAGFAPVARSVPAGEPGHTLFAWLSHSESTARLFLVPDAAIDAPLRAALESIDRACFALFFTGDLAPTQWAGALWALALMSGDVEDLLEILDDLYDDVGSAGAEGAPRGRVEEMAGAWGRYVVADAAALGRRISQVLAFELA